MRFNFHGCIHINWFAKTKFCVSLAELKRQKYVFIFFCFWFSFMHVKEWIKIYSLSSMGNLSCFWVCSFLCRFFYDYFGALKCVHWICIYTTWLCGCIGVIWKLDVKCLIECMCYIAVCATVYGNEVDLERLLICKQTKTANTFCIKCRNKTGEWRN